MAISFYQFTFGPKRCRILELPLELRNQIMNELISDRVENGHVTVSRLAKFPAVMKTCHQVFAESRRSLAILPLYVPEPMMPMESKLINGIKAVYAPKSRFLMMKVHVLFSFDFESKEHLEAQISALSKSCGAHAGTGLMMASPRGLPAPPKGNVSHLTLSSWINCSSRIRIRHNAARAHAAAVQYNLLPLFTWWKPSGIESVGEVLTLDIENLKPWQNCATSRGWEIFNIFRRSIVSIIAAIIDYHPKVPTIKITGLGLCYEVFMSLWSSIPKDYTEWYKQETFDDNSLLIFICSWPFRDRFLPYELFDNGGEEDVQYFPNERRGPGSSDDHNTWCEKVWDARHNRHAWIFEP